MGALVFEWVTESYSMQRHQGKAMEAVLSIMYHVAGVFSLCYIATG